jgi:ribonucleoside-diphosphate reductase alpha chain
MTLRDRFEEEFGDEQLRREDVLRFVEREIDRAVKAAGTIHRERLHTDRKSITRDFKIPCPGHPQGDFVMHATVGQYPDGRPGELFLWADKAGSLASGALTAVSIALSFQWQHGVPFEASVSKLRGMRFEPMGATGDKSYPIVSSPLDYLSRWLLDRFGKKVDGKDG